MMARVSFLMPFYNGGQFLAETLQSIFSQSYQDFDLVIIDDGSTEEWMHLLQPFDKARILIHRKENGGLVNALNYGLEKLDCEFVARIDADDVCFSNRLQTQIDFLDFTQIDAVSNRVLNIDEHGITLGMRGPVREFFRADPQAFPAREPYLPHSFMTSRLAALREVGGYRHAHLAEDADLCWRMSRSHRIMVQDEVVGKYRVHSESVSSSDLKKGRVQAVFSQVAALNEERVLNGRPEIEFQDDLSAQVLRATDLNSTLAQFETITEKEEMDWLAAASAAKFLELGGWRNYRLSVADLSEVKELLKRESITDPEMRDLIRYNASICKKRSKNHSWMGHDDIPTWREKLLSKRPLM